MLKIPLSAHVCLASLFRFLSTVTLRSPHQTKALEETIQFLQANEHRSGKYVRSEHHRGQQPKIVAPVDLSWMSDTWRRVVTGKPGQQFPDSLNHCQAHL
ncbi:MAG TPA: hypothetical protein VFV38_04705 [Ktedonobacteraceae bacterium]|nr:hypothetical protein [Ktedonobacteraceae bacterium]